MLLNYQKPTSWDDKEMDWNSPDPCKIDYWMALREAIQERCAVSDVLNWDFFVGNTATIAIAPSQPATYSWADGIRSAIHDLMRHGKFIDLNYPYKQDGSDFPHFLTANDLITEDCNIAMMPTRGSPLKDFSKWMKDCKSTLCRLTAHSRMMITVETKFASEYAIETGMQDAIKKAWTKTNERDFSTKFVTSTEGGEWYEWMHAYVSAGQTWNREDGEDKKVYSTHIDMSALKIKNVKTFLYGAKPKLKIAVVTSKEHEKDKISYQGGMGDTNFDAGDFDEGLNIDEYPMSEAEIELGNFENFAGGLQPPPDGWDEDNYSKGNIVHTGYKGYVYCVLDYATSGGFRFY